MIIKKYELNKDTGKRKEVFTTDKPGYKIVVDKITGVPSEVKMDTEEKKNRNHGTFTGGKGAVGSRNAQKGKSKINISQEKARRERMDSLEERRNPITAKRKNVEKLQDRLRVAQIEVKEAELEDRENKIKRQEAKVGKMKKFYDDDIEGLKRKNDYLLKDEDKDVVEKIDDIVDDEEVSKTEIKESSFMDKLNKVAKLSSMLGIDRCKGDILSKINKKIEEANNDKKEENPDDVVSTKDQATTSEEPSTDDIGVVDGSDADTPPDEEPTDSTDPADEEPTDEEGNINDEGIDEEPMVHNEIRDKIDTEEYNVDENNAYEFYDYIIDRLNEPNSIKALNTEYSGLPKERRKVTPARVIYDRTLKRLDVMNTEDQNAVDNITGGTQDEGDTI